MVITTQILESRLKETFKDEKDKITIEDLSGGCGAKFQIIIGSDQFTGLGLLERHRLVNNLISDFMNDIHAVQLKTWTLSQYDEKIKQL
ncbi:hypothetical protein CYY_007212 [Polysphondylium violaceum]|uniref:BolA family protein n=1 Tax=Polysphondylium violaceum TaxID=133409 RepID=A0A8J4V527_9MYCE|nr:hypothetical protein CYY_007212 [Polysphondylium violaceum]